MLLIKAATLETSSCLILKIHFTPEKAESECCFLQVWELGGAEPRPPSGLFITVHGYSLGVPQRAFLWRQRPYSIQEYESSCSSLTFIV